MDSQTLPLPVFSHQMAPHTMNHYDIPSIHKNYRSAERSDRLQNGSISSYSRSNTSNAPLNYPSISRPSDRMQSPIPSAKSAHKPEEYQQQKSASNDGISPSLQIPREINSSGGDLAEFAAQVTCLLWFESTEALRMAEKTTSSPSSIKPPVREAIPASGFRKWVLTILSTTQVTQNVILLALLFIYKLKNINPTVKGKVGSEYRLLTVALMLGNKFLDDNTYTNKTWAEVSGIAVGEIHVMEVEFLSNMRYSLLCSKEQWDEWFGKLRNFWNYFDQASRTPLPSPVSGYNPSLLPSPPTSMQSSPPCQAAYPPKSKSSNSFTHGHQYPHYPAPSSPLPSMPDLDLRPSSRKRSHDGTCDEPPTKRMVHTHDGSCDEPPMKRMVHQPSLATPVHSSSISNRQNLPRLPIPNLTISTREPMHPVSGNYSAQSGPVLPPISGRAMSSVYPTTPAYPQQQPLLTPTGTHPMNSAFSTPSRHHSPHSFQDLLSVGSSPTTSSYSRNPLGHNSPSLFLQQRSSPYKPVRTVHTLLHPPPHNSMQGFPTRVGQMHYQPLGKRNDFRSGIVPDYQHPSYSQTQNRGIFGFGDRSL